MTSISANVVGDRVLNIGTADHAKSVENVSAQIGWDVLGEETRLLDLAMGAPVGEIADSLVGLLN